MSGRSRSEPESKVKARSRRGGERERGTPELVTLGLSLLVLAVVVSVTAWLEISRGDAHPRLEVTPDFGAVYVSDEQYYLPVEVTNTGDRPTDSVRVDLVRPIEGEQPEVVDLEFTFVAGGETEHGLAVFDERPTADSIEVDVVSVILP